MEDAGEPKLVCALCKEIVTGIFDFKWSLCLKCSFGFERFITSAFDQLKNSKPQLGKRRNPDINNNLPPKKRIILPPIRTRPYFVDESRSKPGDCPYCDGWCVSSLVKSKAK